jgi:hypothetical protein
VTRPVVTRGPFLFDGEPAYRAICPGCGVEAILDDDQYHGRVSILCDCGYHETHDLSRPA